MSVMTMKKRYLTGMLSGAGSVLFKTGLNIVVIPVLIAYLGLEAFSLYMLLVGLLEISMFLDLGLSNTLVKLLNTEESPDNHTRRGYLKIAQILFLLLAALFLSAGFLLLPHLSGWIHVSPQLAPLLETAVLLMLLEAIVTIYSCYYQTVLLSHCAHQWNNLGDMTHHVIANGGALLLLFAGFDLPAILMIRLLGAVVRLAFLGIQARCVEPFVFQPDVPLQIPQLREVIRLSYHAMTLNLSIIVSHKVDDIVIARFLPLSAVGVFEIVFRFLGLALQICLKLSEGAFPIFTRMAGQPEQTANARELFLRMSNFLHFTAMILIMLIVSFYTELFGIFSAGRIPVAETYPLLLVAIPCVLSGVLQMPAGAWLFAWGHYRFLSLSSLAAASANLILSLLLVQPLGIVGVALGTLLPQLVQHQAGLIRKTCRELGIPFAEYVRRVHLNILLPVGLAVGWVQLWKPASTEVGEGIASLPFIALIAASAFLLAFAIWFPLTASATERNLARDKFLLPMKVRMDGMLKTLNAKRTLDNAR